MKLFSSLSELGTGLNSMQKYLIPENVECASGDKSVPRNVVKCHFIWALPEPVQNPYFVAESRSCADYLGVSSSDRSQFVSVFSGNKLLPNLGTPYCTAYGCHSYGTWFGQLGDGRAMSIGEVFTTDATSVQNNADSARALDMLTYGSSVNELQLKGCGRSAFSRGFDGRAVMRSSIREFLGEFLCLEVLISPVSQRPSTSQRRRPCTTWACRPPGPCR